MKTTIRRECFETNSSSSHTITIKKSNHNHVPKSFTYKPSTFNSAYSKEKDPDNEIFKVSSPDELYTYLVSSIDMLYSCKDDGHDPIKMVNNFINNLTKWGYTVHNSVFKESNDLAWHDIEVMYDDQGNLDKFEQWLLNIINNNKEFQKFIKSGIIYSCNRDRDNFTIDEFKRKLGE